MRLQEKVENWTVNLVVSTTKLTARSLIRGLRWYLMSRNRKRTRKAMAHEEGKQSVVPYEGAVHGEYKTTSPSGVQLNVFAAEDEFDSCRIDENERERCNAAS